MGAPVAFFTYFEDADAAFKKSIAAGASIYFYRIETPHGVSTGQFAITR